MNEPQKGTDAIMLAPQAMTNTATATANLDTIGADYATIRVALASEINVTAVGPGIVLSHGDTTSTWTALSTRTAEDITAAKTVTYHVDMRGKQRYLRLAVTTATATNDNVTLSAVSSLTRQVEAPGATTEMADVGVIL